jgi:hypothetical protein
MDAQFWWGIVGGVAVTILLGLPLNFFANIYTPNLVDGWNRKKSARQERSKAKALASYNIVTELRSGKRDRYLYLLGEYIGVLVGFLLTVLCVTFTTLLLVLFSLHRSGEKGVTEQWLLVAPEATLSVALILMVLTSLVMLITFSLNARVTTLKWRLDHFEEYRAQIEKKWGSLT